MVMRMTMVMRMSTGMEKKARMLIFPGISLLSVFYLDTITMIFTSTALA